MFDALVEEHAEDFYATQPGISDASVMGVPDAGSRQHIGGVLPPQ